MIQVHTHMYLIQRKRKIVNYRFRPKPVRPTSSPGSRTRRVPDYYDYEVKENIVITN